MYRLGDERQEIAAKLKKAGAVSTQVPAQNVVKAKLGGNLLTLRFKADAVESIEVGSGYIFFRGTLTDLGKRMDTEKLVQNRWRCGKAKIALGSTTYPCGAGVSFSFGAPSFPGSVTLERSTEAHVSCEAALGAKEAKVLVDRCIRVSPATRPPCNASNDCGLIQSEILRACALLGKKEKRALCP